MTSDKTSDTVYIAQVAILGDFYALDQAHIEREGVFSSWVRAREFLAREQYEKPEEVYLKGMRLIIIKYVLDDNEPEAEIHYWVFDISGKLIEEIPPYRRWNENRYEAKYAVGDIVWVKSNIYCVESNSVNGYYAVVGWVPKKKAEWLSEGRPAEEWEDCYVLYYIHPCGTRCHSHEPESVVEKVSDSDENVPPFLRLYSKHLRGQVQLPQQLLEDLEDGKVFLRDDLKHYQLYLDSSEIEKRKH